MATATLASKLLTLGLTGALGAAGLIAGPTIGPKLEDAAMVFGSEPGAVSVSAPLDDGVVDEAAEAHGNERARMADPAVREAHRAAQHAERDARHAARDARHAERDAERVARRAEREAEHAARHAARHAERDARQAARAQARDARRAILRDGRPAPSVEGSRGLTAEQRDALRAARPAHRAPR